MAMRSLAGVLRQLDEPVDCPVRSSLVEAVKRNRVALRLLALLDVGVGVVVRHGCTGGREPDVSQSASETAGRRRAHVGGGWVKLWEERRARVTP